MYSIFRTLARSKMGSYDPPPLLIDSNGDGNFPTLLRTGVKDNEDCKPDSLVFNRICTDTFSGLLVCILVEIQVSDLS